MRSTRLLVVPLVGALLALTGCSSSSSNAQPVEQQLTAAKLSFDTARFIGFSLTSDDLPGGVDALKAANGTGTHLPAFRGEVQIVKGLTFEAPVVAIGDTVFAKLPFLSCTKINPADYGAPNPAALMDRQTGLSSLLTDTVDPTIAGTERSGSLVLTKINGTLPGAAVRALFPSSAETPFKVTYTLTSDDALHGVSMTGPFYGDHGTSTYAIVLDLAADPISITPLC